MTDSLLASLESVGVLTVEFDGRKSVFATRLRGRDPLEMTLSEWMAEPAVSASVMLDQTLRATQSRSTPEDGEG